METIPIVFAGAGMAIALVFGIIIGANTGKKDKPLTSAQDLEKLYHKRLEAVITDPEKTPEDRIVAANRLRDAYQLFASFFFKA